MAFKHHGNANGFLAERDRRNAAESRNIENVAVGQAALPALRRLHKVVRFAVILEKPLDSAGCKPMEFGGLVVGDAHDFRITRAVHDGVGGEVGAKLPGAGPWVRAIMDKAIGGVILRGFLGRRIIDLAR